MPLCCSFLQSLAEQVLSKVLQNSKEPQQPLEMRIKVQTSGLFLELIK